MVFSFVGARAHTTGRTLGEIYGDEAGLANRDHRNRAETAKAARASSMNDQRPVPP